jgi:serine/threonine-protein kinase HipA
MASDDRWRFSPTYDLTFNSGPGGEHQMDICGEAKSPTRTHLLNLATKTGIAPKAASESIDRIAGVASQFRSFAKNLPITKATLDAMSSVVSANQARMI